jgi:polysaccharide biosynthesis transport protein
MNNSRQPEHHASAGIALSDIYFIIFRHKWKIIILAAAGIVAAVVFYLIQPAPFYRSEAELLVKYVLDSRTVSTSTKETSLDEQGQNIINGELAIITSLDIANTVAQEIGPEKILAKMGGGSNAIIAGVVIRNNLIVGSGGGGVINVAFRHPDATIVQSVLTNVIAEYLNKHKEIHQSADVNDETLNDESLQLRSQIGETERLLRAARTNAGIITLDNAEESISAEFSKLQEKLYDTRAELAEREAMVSHMTNLLAVKSEMVTNAATNAAITTFTTDVPSDQREEYKEICSRLDFLQKRVDDLVTVQGYREQNSRVKDVREQLDEVTKQKAGLEKNYPQLASSGTSSDPLASNPMFDDLATNLKQIALLQSRIMVLSNQMNQVRTDANNVDVAASNIQDLQRDQQIDEGNYQYLKTRLSQAVLDEKLAPGRVSNIDSIQNPTPAFKEPTAPLKQPLRMIFGGIFAGLALAFLIELCFDRTMKRPIEIETKLKLPLFLSVPDLSKMGSAHLAYATKRRQLQFGNGHESSVSAVTDGTALVKNGKLEVTPSNHNGILQPFCDALRDRLITYFEIKNITHKPKLVAVTSPNKGSGVTTIAAGLAASLSETGDGNVLLVDMNIDNGEMQKFFKGKSIGRLDDLLEGKTRDNALVQENLYVVTEGRNGEGVPRILPKRFAAIVPKLKASDYDYIIFDMPPVSQTSITARLSGFMDMVLLVVESEKTDRDGAQRATALLAESNANVSAVLNKTQKYVPTRLLPDDFYQT